jgi:hypothetical protein
MKTGRNDPCPCGSGVKYKRCHLDRENQKPMTEGEVIGMASSHKIDKKCFHPSTGKGSCQGKIIQSHTISKSSSLKKVARNGKVLHFKPSISSLFDNDGNLSVEEVGINQASTFPGFCKKHDKEMFSPIEDKDFECNEYNSFLLGYRALTKEIYAKESVIDFIPKMRSLDRGYTMPDQAYVQNMLNSFQQGSEWGIRDLKYHKEKYDNAFRSKDYSGSNFYIIKFSNVPHLLYSGAIYPEYDFQGRLLQTLGTDDQLDHISVNAISTPVGGCVVFQWMEESEVNCKFIRSLNSLRDEIKASAITQFVFESFENLYMEPSWWESLGTMQKTLSSRVMCGASTRNHEPSCFVHDGEEYHHWKEIKIETNIEI